MYSLFTSSLYPIRCIKELHNMLWIINNCQEKKLKTYNYFFIYIPKWHLQIHINIIKAYSVLLIIVLYYWVATTDIIIIPLNTTNVHYSSPKVIIYGYSETIVCVYPHQGIWTQNNFWTCFEFNKLLRIYDELLH